MKTVHKRDTPNFFRPKKIRKFHETPKLAQKKALSLPECKELNHEAIERVLKEL